MVKYQKDTQKIKSILLNDLTDYIEKYFKTNPDGYFLSFFRNSYFLKSLTMKNYLQQVKKNRETLFFDDVMRTRVNKFIELLTMKYSKGSFTLKTCEMYDENFYKEFFVRATKDLTIRNKKAENYIVGIDKDTEPLEGEYKEFYEIIKGLMLSIHDIETKRQFFYNHYRELDLKIVYFNLILNLFEFSFDLTFDSRLNKRFGFLDESGKINFDILYDSFLSLNQIDPFPPFSSKFVYFVNFPNRKERVDRILI